MRCQKNLEKINIKTVQYKCCWISKMSTLQESSDDLVASLSKTRKRKSIGETAKREKKAQNPASPHIKKSKTLVVHPKQIQWPIVNEEINIKLLSELEEALRLLKKPVGKPSLKDIREVPKADRKEFRKQFRGQQATSLGVDLSGYFKRRSSLAIGINCVSKHLEKDQISAVIIDPDVDPPMMTKLLIPIANAKSVPIVAAKGLVATISSACDINCLALGLKRCCDDKSSLLNPVLETIRGFLSGQPLPSPQSTSEKSKSTPISEYTPTKIRKLN